MRKTEPPPAHDWRGHYGVCAVQSSACLVGYSTRVPCWVPEMLTLAYISVHSLFVPYVLKSLVFRRFDMKKGLPDFSENPQGGVRGIRTLEPLKTTNTLAGCPYRPLRHDSTVLPFSRRNSMQLYHPFAGKTPYLAKKMRKR